MAVRPYEIASWLPMIQPGTPLDQFLHLMMPVAVLTFFNMAPWSRFVRSSMLEVLRQDYVRTARAKGSDRAGRDHEARAAQRADPVRDDRGAVDSRRCSPARSSPRRSLPGRAWGGCTTTRCSRSDWPVALAFIFITALLTVVATLLGDILYTVVDPRIKFS